jgi:hypothetical protein
MNRFRADIEQVRASIAMAKPQHIIAVAASILLIFDTFIKSLSVVALGLAVLALSPWLIQFIKTLELAGIKFEFRDQLEKVTERMSTAGLLSEPEETDQRPTYEEVFNTDPTLALAGLRIALEQRLRDLFEAAGSQRPRGGLVFQINRLGDLGVLDTDQISAIADLMPLLNKAVHSEEYSREAAGWAMSVGPALLAALDHKIAALKKGE